MLGNILPNQTLKKMFYTPLDISKAKYKNVTKQCVNSLIKEWIRYAKQRHKQLKKFND